MIVKKVGQGFGKKSLRALVQLPIEAIEFMAHGGTFSQTGIAAGDKEKLEIYKSIAQIGQCGRNGIFCQWTETGIRQSVLVQAIYHLRWNQNFLRRILSDGETGRNIRVRTKHQTLLQYAEKSYEALEQFLHFQMKGWNWRRRSLKWDKPDSYMGKNTHR